MGRRSVLSVLLSIAAGTLPASLAETVTIDADSAAGFILSCRKENGAFGPADQFYTDAAWNFPAVAGLELLGVDIERPKAILENGLGYPDGHVGYGHWQFFHYHKIRELLGEPIDFEFRSVRIEHQGADEIRYYGSPFGTDGDTFFKAGGGRAPDPRDAGARTLGYYNLSSLYYLIEALKASGREVVLPPVKGPIEGLAGAFQAPNGGFVDVRDGASLGKNRDAHVAHTFQALYVMTTFGVVKSESDLKRCADFLRSCQDRGGGFRFHPDKAIAGNAPDIYYTWAALKALDLLGEKPADAAACITWINALQNADGGFGDQPGWRSRLYSSYYAIDSLAMLTGGKPRTAIMRKTRELPEVQPIPKGRYRVYQALFKTPVVEAGDLEGLAERGFNLLAMKSDDFAMAASLRSKIRESGLPMDIALCPEAYSHRARREGGALLHHILNPTLDPGWEAENRARWQKIDAAGAIGLEWDDYQRQVLRPLRQMGALVYPEQDFEMEVGYSAYDSGIHGEAGYNAFLAGFNWAPRDFVRVFPWRERYVDKLTPMADCDAHGDLQKWSPQLDHVRNLFIAEGPGYDDFLEAAAKRRVVCVIRNTGAGEPPATYYGPEAAVAFVRERVGEWRWWGTASPP